MSQGLRIAKFGYDADDVEEKHRVYDSNFNTFKYVRYFVINVDSAAAAQTYTVPHGLGYAPSFLIFTKGTDFDEDPETFVTNPNVNGAGDEVTIQSDKTNIYVNTQFPSGYDFDIIVLIGADDLDDTGS